MVVCKEGKYQDVTPPDEGDEGQDILFQPSSLIYEGFSPEKIADYNNCGLEVRMGKVCKGMALQITKAALDRYGQMIVRSEPRDVPGKPLLGVGDARVKTADRRKVGTF